MPADGMEMGRQVMIAAVAFDQVNNLSNSARQKLFIAWSYFIPIAQK